MEWNVKQMRAKYAEEVLNEVTQKILGKPLQAVVKKMPFGRNWARKEFRRAAALQRQFTVHLEIKNSVFVVYANWHMSSGLALRNSKLLANVPSPSSATPKRKRRPALSISPALRKQSMEPQNIINVGGINIWAWQLAV